MSTPDARRNPYLVLGVDYGAPHEEVTAAYARRSRVARADSGYPYSIDDLVWALDEIERLNGTTQVAGAGIQATAVTFRVPADPTAYGPPPGPGLLRPDPVPLRRRTRPAPRTEIAGLVTDARRDATAYALVQLAQQAERDLIAPAGRVRLSLPEPPRQPRSRGPWVALFAVLALAVVAVVLFVVGRGSDHVTQESTVAPTTTEFVVVTSPPAEGFRTPVESGGLTITPTDPLSVFGYTCVLWQLSGAAPLTFDPSAAEFEVAGNVLRDDPNVRSDRAPASIDPAATQATAETCFATGDTAPASTPVSLRYTVPGSDGSTPYRWNVVMP